MSAYLDLFVADAREHLGDAFELIARVDAGESDPESWRELLRHAHSIKGMAATLGYESMVRLAHALEDNLDDLRDAIDASQQETDRDTRFIREGLACLATMIDRVESGDDPHIEQASELARALRGSDGEGASETALAVEPTEPVPAHDDEKLWRLRIDLDARRDSALETVALLARVGELGRVLHASPPRLRADTSRLEGGLELLLRSRLEIDRLRSSLAACPNLSQVSIRPASHEPAPPTATRAPEGRWVRVRSDHLDRVASLALELRLEHAHLARRLDTQERCLHRSNHLISGLESETQQLRLIPFDTIAPRLHQCVAELLRPLGKEASLEITGGELRVDRGILEHLSDPLLHLVRNALDHGIEPPLERARRNKPQQGRLRIHAGRDGDRTRIVFEDDGRGIDTEAVVTRAIAEGRITADSARLLRADQALRLVTLSRLSTANTVSHVSGRGIGLDVVRSEIERSGGTIEIESEPGEFTRITLWLPQTDAIVPALVIEACGASYALPLSEVQRVTETDAERSAGSLLSLTRLLAVEAPADGEPESSGVLLRGEPSLVLAFDGDVRCEELSVVPLRPPLSRIATYSGAALLEDGEVALLLDPRHLRRLAAAPPAA